MEYFDEIYTIYKIISNDIKFFKFKRFGIRKFNQCLIVNFANLNNYFEKDYFSILNKDDSFKTCDLKEFYKEGNYNINLCRAVNTGDYQEYKNIHQIIIDSDIYIYPDDSTIPNFETNAMQMNDKLFELYKNLLCENFLNSLCEDTFDNTDIIGVDSNEK